MSTTESQSKPTIGFLTVLQQPQHGLFGGYLILNTSGRPLEFHCTAPIKPNLAQEILYGPTLESFLYGEQIGQTLLKQSSLQPLMVCTDRAPAMTVREFVSTPVVLVLEPEQSVTVETSDKKIRFDRPHSSGPNLLCFQLGRNHLAIPARADEERRNIEEKFGEAAENFDLNEPFERIRAAIEEAQQAVK
jgi:hypothetical protein